MASVRVAVRVRPFNEREIGMDSSPIIEMNGNKTRIATKIPEKPGKGWKEFTFDHSYWSFNEQDEHFVSQQKVFEDLGRDVVSSAFEGYNACVFAYGQSGSGKTFTMMGSKENQGLIPRICLALFSRMTCESSYRVEVSYLEIYNEKVKDLLDSKSKHNLRVREHPRLGPIVKDLSKHIVCDYPEIQELIEKGNTSRTTASTNMNNVSSRSHAIFSITFTQARISNGLPTETVSKIHLVDLAGSERAYASGDNQERLKEGSHINKSLVTLGTVISALAESSQIEPGSKNVFIPYRDSVLTWLLKDSLGGNSKTIMIAAISPADCNYPETLSTLRYANRAKNIINKPTINEDPNVKLIRELRQEITKLKSLINNEYDPHNQVLETLQQKEEQEKVLTQRWSEKWRESKVIFEEQQALALRKYGTGVILDSERPHLICIDDDLLSTGVTLYHLMEGETLIGTEMADEKQHIVLSGASIEPEHCRIVLKDGEALLCPKGNALCLVNGVIADKPTKLFQGCNILLGRTNMFRYNDPAQAEKIRKEGDILNLNLTRMSLMSWSTTDLSSPSDPVKRLDTSSSKSIKDSFDEDSVPNLSSDVSPSEPIHNPTTVENDSSPLQNSGGDHHDIQDPLRSMDNGANEERPSTPEARSDPILEELVQQINALHRSILHEVNGGCSSAEMDGKIALLQELKKKWKELQDRTADGNRGFDDQTFDQSITSDARKLLLMESSFHHSTSLSQPGSSYDLRSCGCFMGRSPSGNSLGDSLEPYSVKIPLFVLRGKGSSTHFAYEVVLQAGFDKWIIYRRYSRFRELHMKMKETYGVKVAELDFPPRKFFFHNTECVAKRRRPVLEAYLNSLVKICSQDPASPIFICPEKPPRKELLHELSSFFKRGTFETGKYSTS